MCTSNSKTRLNEFRESINVSKNAFEVKCGLTRGYLSNPASMPSTPILEKIHDAYPELSMDWLLFGEGTMMRADILGERQQHFNEMQVMYEANEELSDKVKELTYANKYSCRIQSDDGNDIISNLLKMIQNKDEDNKNILKQYMAKVAECDSLRIAIQKMQEQNTSLSQVV